MGECRNCGSHEMKELGFVGAVSPFFLKRVFRMEVNVVKARNLLKVILGRVLKPVKPLFSRLYARAVMVEMQACRVCSFSQMKEMLPEEWINRLYVDYRSETYNAERILYEPEYAAIARHIGLPREAELRVRALTKWLEGKMEMAHDFSMLDYGGADGRFLPELPGRKYVYEISDYQPAPGITRVGTAEELGKYSFVQLAHVLEHVMSPLALVRAVTEHLAPAGYLYLEVPQEKSDQEMQALLTDDRSKTLSVHEHINGYSSKAISRLLEAAGLELIAVHAEKINYGYAAWTIVRALGRRKS